MQDQKIKFWFADRKKVSKTRIPKRAARKGQFYKPCQINRYHEAIFTDCKTAIFWNKICLVNLPDTLSRLHIPPSCKPVLCLLPPKRKNPTWWTHILWDLSSSSASCERTSQVHFHQTQENLVHHSPAKVSDSPSQLHVSWCQRSEQATEQAVTVCCRMEPSCARAYKWGRWGSGRKGNVPERQSKMKEYSLLQVMKKTILFQ